MPSSSVTSETQALAAIRSGACFGILKGYSLLQLAGPDVARFLQNQTTQDIPAIQPGTFAPAASVERQGKLQGTFLLYCLKENDYLAFIETAQLENLLEHFGKYKLFDQFSLETLDLQPFVVLGPQTKQLTLPDGIDALPITWAGLNGQLLLTTPEQSASLSERLRSEASALIPLTAEYQEALRIEAGLPKYGVDMDNKTLLPETGLHEGSVSYTKGCYLGQEVIAKVKTYGRVPRALAGIKFSEALNVQEALALLGTACQNNGKTVGTISSILPESSIGVTIALVYLDRENRTPGQTLTVGQYKAEVVHLPFVAVNNLSNRQREALLHEALHLFAEGKDDAAIDGLEKLLNSAADTTNETPDPITVQATEALGVIYGRLDQVDKAIAYMHQLLEYDPDSIMAHTNLSIFYLKQGNKELAEEEKAKATIAGMRQKAREAGIDFKKLDEEREKREQEKLKQLEERVSLFKDALSYSPDDPLGNYGLGSVLIELRRHEEAIEPLQKTVAAQPNHSVAHLLLGKALEAVNKGEAAASIYEKGIQVAAAKGDRMPLEEMQQRLGRLQQK